MPVTLETEKYGETNVKKKYIYIYILIKQFMACEHTSYQITLLILHGNSEAAAPFPPGEEPFFSISTK